MKILITGATGFVGQALCNHLVTSGHQVIGITRNKENAKKSDGNMLSQMTWEEFKAIDARTGLEVDYVINLAGESIGSGRWTNLKKQRIMDSRINATKIIVDSIENGFIQPKVLISASAVGYYGDRGDETITEDSTSGTDFLADVSKAWEEVANRAKQYGVRVVTLRIGAVLGQGGALEKMILPFKFFAGGPLGSGNQWFSWIHLNDLVGMIHFAMESTDIEGPVNATSPYPERNKDFNRTVGKIMKRPSWFPAPGFALRLVLGEMSDLLLKGQKVLPKKMMGAGYVFQYPTATLALQNILNKRYGYPNN